MQYYNVHITDHIFPRMYVTLRDHNWVHLPIGHSVRLYIEFNLCYLKNLKMFLFRVKELFEPKVLQRKADGFLLFLKAFS